MGTILPEGEKAGNFSAGWATSRPQVSYSSELREQMRGRWKLSFPGPALKAVEVSRLLLVKSA